MEQEAIDEAWEWYWAKVDADAAIEAAKQAEFESQVCARCGHTRSDHFSLNGRCRSCFQIECGGFLTETEYTEELRSEWKNAEASADAEYQQMLDEQYDEMEMYSEDRYYEEQEEYERLVSEFNKERMSQWGEGIEVCHSIFGGMTVGALEGEWITFIRDMRKQKSFPEEVIDDLERKFEEARKDLYPASWSYDDDDDYYEDDTGDEE